MSANVGMTQSTLCVFVCLCGVGGRDLLSVAAVATSRVPCTEVSRRGRSLSARRSTRHVLPPFCISHCPLPRLPAFHVLHAQLHFPFPYVGGMEALAEGLAAACERGMCRSVGVSNFNAQQVTRVMCVGFFRRPHRTGSFNTIRAF